MSTVSEHAQRAMLLFYILYKQVGVGSVRWVGGQVVSPGSGFSQVRGGAGVLTWEWVQSSLSCTANLSFHSLHISLRRRTCEMAETTMTNQGGTVRMSTVSLVGSSLL